MPTSESFDFQGPVGRLEAILMSPDDGSVAAAVVCHAHPLHGGMMHFKVVFRIAKALQEQRVAVLRFNFRGVGRSEGAHDDGRGEQDDAIAALAELERRVPGVPLVMAGFSFGSVVALRVAAREPRVRAVAALGFPLVRFGDAATLQAPRQPRLFVQGERDPFGAGDALRALVEPLPPPRELVVVPGASHFFDDRLEAMQAAVSAWAAKRPWG
jgi:uncharacterized protein